MCCDLRLRLELRSKINATSEGSTAAERNCPRKMSDLTRKTAKSGNLNHFLRILLFFPWLSLCFARKKRIPPEFGRYLVLWESRCEPAGELHMYKSMTTILADWIMSFFCARHLGVWKGNGKFPVWVELWKSNSLRVAVNMKLWVGQFEELVTAWCNFGKERFWIGRGEKYLLTCIIPMITSKEVLLVTRMPDRLSCLVCLHTPNVPGKFSKGICSALRFFCARQLRPPSHSLDFHLCADLSRHWEIHRCRMHLLGRPP